MSERLTDHERVRLVALLLCKLAAEGCNADPVYMTLLRKFVGTDKVVWIDEGTTDAQIAGLREIVRHYNPDDAIFDEENGLRPMTDADFHEATRG